MPCTLLTCSTEPTLRLDPFLAHDLAGWDDRYFPTPWITIYVGGSGFDLSDCPWYLIPSRGIPSMLTATVNSSPIQQARTRVFTECARSLFLGIRSVEHLPLSCSSERTGENRRRLIIGEGPVFGHHAWRTENGYETGFQVPDF